MVWVIQVEQMVGQVGCFGFWGDFFVCWFFKCMNYIFERVVNVCVRGDSGSYGVQCSYKWQFVEGLQQ